jgi:LCP family protein required for cell wall assembly
MRISQDYLASSLPRRHILRTVLMIVGGLLVVLAVVVGAYALGLTSTFDSAKKITQSFPKEAARPAVAENASQNILLIGSDTGSRGADASDVEGTRSDTMMVVHISANRDTVHVMSIMRNSWVDIAGYGQDRLNSALVYGGVPLAVQTVESLIDARIDRVASVDFEGFKGITDALGGVAIENPKEFTASSGDKPTFAKGPIVLNGEESLAFVRESDAFPDGDFQRIRNQQIFIRGMLAKVLSAETLTNPGKVNALVSATTPYLEVDKGFTSTYAAGLGFELRNLRMDDVTFFTLPILGQVTRNGQAVIDVDWNQVAVVRDHFKEDTLSEYKPKAIP